MIGPILLALSWFLLRLEGKGLAVLGLNAPVVRLRQFGAGVVVAGLVVVIQQLGHAAVADVPWRPNPAADAELLVGNPVMMAFIFVLTGAFGYMLAFAFAETTSIALPIGLHLGWNLVSYLGFSTGPFGAGLFVPGNGAARLEATGLFSLLLDVALPLLLVAGECTYLTRTYPRGSPATSPTATEAHS
jgi:hypothetical protein